jgi:hypothetical protein
MLKVLFYVAIVVAFGWFFFTVDWSQLADVSVHPGWMVLATLIAIGFRYWGVMVWRVVLKRLGAGDLPSLLIMADIYAKAWLARYIPGTVPWIAGKIYLASEHGISKSRLAVSTLVEAAAQVIGVGAVSLALLATDSRIAQVSPVLRWLVAAGAVALVVAMVVFNRMLRLAMRVAKRGTAVDVTWNVVLSSVGLYAIGALISGGSYALLVYALVPDLAVRDMVFLVGAFGLAGVVGMLTPLVPSGLGTRDGAQLLLLLVVLPAPVAGLVVLVSRVWSALVDFLFWLVAWSTHRWWGAPRP